MFDWTTAELIGTSLLIIVTAALSGAVGYATGHKDGSREGYTRGRAVSRHLAGKAVK